MHGALTRTICLVTLAGVSAALAGCATQVPTTDKWAISQGFQPVELQGRSYFCRPQAQAGKPGQYCMTLAQLRATRFAGPAEVQGFENPVPPGAPSLFDVWLAPGLLD